MYAVAVVPPLTWKRKPANRLALSKMFPYRSCMDINGPAKKIKNSKSRMNYSNENTKLGTIHIYIYILGN